MDNGKPREFTEYILTGDMEKNFKNNSKIDRNYNQYYTGPHYQFASESNPVDLSTALIPLTAQRLISRLSIIIPS